MSRTTTALKRLAVPGLAAVTMIAGIPVLASTAANAAPGDTIVMTPETDSASVGTCNVFTVQVRNSAGQPATSTVDIVVTERNTGTADTGDVTFCERSADGSDANETGADGGFTPQAAGSGGADNDATNLRADRDHAQFVPNKDGIVTFGIESTTAQVVDVRAFLEEDNNNTFNDGETSDTSVKTFTAGGQDAVETVDAEPETQNAFTGQAATFTATIRNAAGDPVAGVDVDGAVLSGPNAQQAVSCGVSNNNGIATCTLIGTTAGTDTVRIFVDESNRRADTFDAGEPFDDVTVTFVAAPTGLTVTLTCSSPAGAASGVCTNDPSDPNATFVATVTNSSGVRQAGVLVRFSLVSDENTGTNNDDRATLTPLEATTDANGQAVVTVTEPAPVDGETIVIRATIAGQAGGNNTDTATLEFNEATPDEARFVNLTPEAGNLAVGSEVTATVTDRFGNPVSGVQVVFTETGDGNFNGTSSATAITNASGTASATLNGTVGGTSSVTATINSAACDDAAEAATTTTPAVAAGNCTDTEQFTLTSASASPSPSATTAPPSATPTGTVTPPATPCGPATVRLFDTTIIATGAARGEVRGTPNSVVELHAYTRPSTTYFVARRIEVGADGIGEFLITPPANTRLFAVQAGCTEASPSIVLNVRTQLSLNVERLGKQTYRFFGSAIPARPNGLIVSLYRVTDSGRQVLTSQVRANANRGQAGFDATRPAGSYSITRTFTGTGRFGFVVRTGQDLQNAPGSSNVRSLLIF